MMLFELESFDERYPETFPEWKNLDSYVLSAISVEIVKQINIDIETEERYLVPGLRRALNLISQEVVI